MRLFVVLALLALVAGCSARAPPAPEAVDAVVAESLAVPEPKRSVVEGQLLIAAALPGRSTNLGGSYAFPLEVDDNVTRIDLHLEWTAATESANRLSLWVRERTDPMETGTALSPPKAVHKAAGTSPLAAELPRGVFPDAGDYEVLVRADDSATLPVVQQPFKLHVIVYDATVPMPADEHGHSH